MGEEGEGPYLLEEQLDEAQVAAAGGDVKHRLLVLVAAVSDHLVAEELLHFRHILVLNRSEERLGAHCVQREFLAYVEVLPAI